MFFVNKKNNLITSFENLINKTDIVFQELLDSNVLSKLEFENYINIKKKYSINDNINIITNNKNYPLSVIGTTSCGKSTFINGLLGAKLSPMDSDELTNSLIKFNYIDGYGFKASLTVTNKDNNFKFDDFYENIYNKIYEIIDENKNNDLYSKININLTHLVGKEWKKFIYNNSILKEIIDLPGIKSINDKKNLEIIKDNVSDTFKVFIFDYSSIFKKEDRVKIYKMLNEIKQNYSENEILFILNKVDLKNSSDKPIQNIIDKVKIELNEYLSLSFYPEIIEFNSLLFFYMQNAFLGYQQLTFFQFRRELIRELIHNNIKNCFIDQAKFIAKIKNQDPFYHDLIIKIENILKEKNKIPNFKDFMFLWEKSFEDCGGKIFFEKLNIFYSDGKILSKKNIDLYFIEIKNLLYTVKSKNSNKENILNYLCNEYDNLDRVIKTRF